MVLYHPRSVSVASIREESPPPLNPETRATEYPGTCKMPVTSIFQFGNLVSYRSRGCHVLVAPADISGTDTGKFINSSVSNDSFREKSCVFETLCRVFFSRKLTFLRTRLKKWNYYMLLRRKAVKRETFTNFFCKPAYLRHSLRAQWKHARKAGK